MRCAAWAWTLPWLQGIHLAAHVPPSHLLAHPSQFPTDDEFIQRMRAFWRDPDGRSMERFRRVVMFI